MQPSAFQSLSHCFVVIGAVSQAWQKHHCSLCLGFCLQLQPPALPWGSAGPSETVCILSKGRDAIACMQMPGLLLPVKAMARRAHVSPSIYTNDFCQKRLIALLCLISQKFSGGSSHGIRYKEDDASIYVRRCS